MPGSYNMIIIFNFILNEYPFILSQALVGWTDYNYLENVNNANAKGIENSFTKWVLLKGLHDFFACYHKNTRF